MLTDFVNEIPPERDIRSVNAASRQHPLDAFAGQ
jgi:hypothetical protein